MGTKVISQLFANFKDFTKFYLNSRRPAFRRSNVFGGPCTPISPSTNNVPLFIFFSILVSHPTCHFFLSSSMVCKVPFLCLSWIVVDLSQKFTPILMGL